MFYREEKKTRPVKSIPLVKSLELIESHDKLLKDKKHPELIALIKKNLAFGADDYKKLALPLIENVARAFQHLPETSLYYSGRGGLLDRVLNRTEAALGLMQALLVKEDGNMPSEEQKLWLYVVFSAGLLRGIGRLYGEYKVKIYDEMAVFRSFWRPLHEDMSAIGSYYSYEFSREEDQNARKHITLLMAQRLMPADGYERLSAHPAIFYAWLALLEEDRDGSGPLDAILDRANAIAAQRYLMAYVEEHEYLIDNSMGRVSSFLDSTPESIIEREQAIGAEFLLWVHDHLADGRFILNKPPMHAEIFPSGVVLSPEVFDMFVQSHLKFKNKFAVQRAAQAWNKHNQEALGEDGLQAQTLSKFKLDNAVLPEKVTVYSSKTEHLSTVDTLDLVNDMQAFARDHEQKATRLHQLERDGQWSIVEEKAPQVKRGNRPGG